MIALAGIYPRSTFWFALRTLSCQICGRVQVYARQVIAAWMQIPRLEDFYASDACLEQCPDHISEPPEAPRLLPT